MGQNSEDCADGREKERRVENWVTTCHWSIDIRQI